MKTGHNCVRPKPRATTAKRIRPKIRNLDWMGIGADVTANLDVEVIDDQNVTVTLEANSCLKKPQSTPIPHPHSSTSHIGLCPARPEPFNRHNDCGDDHRRLRFWRAFDHRRRHQLPEKRRGARDLPRVTLSLADSDVLVCPALVSDRRVFLRDFHRHSARNGGFHRRRRVGHLPDRSRVAGAARSKTDVYEQVTAALALIPRSAFQIGALIADSIQHKN